MGPVMLGVLLTHSISTKSTMMSFEYSQFLAADRTAVGLSPGPRNHWHFPAQRGQNGALGGTAVL